MGSNEYAIMQKPLSELIAEQLRARIWDKDMAFGERLLETDLAQEYDVSRSTIREALKILEAEELVVSQARKGTYVADFTGEDFNEMIELRALLETTAFKKALPEINEEHLNNLENIIHEMKEKAEVKDWNALFDLDTKFHSYIVNLSGNSRIVKIYASLQIQIRTFLMHLDKYYSSHQSFYEEHKDLYEALKSKDAEKVQEKVRRHIEYVEEKLLDGNYN